MIDSLGFFLLGLIIGEIGIGGMCFYWVKSKVEWVKRKVEHQKGSFQ